MNIYSIGDARVRTDILDGSSRIFIEIVRRWVMQGSCVYVVTSEASYEFYKKYNLPVNYIVVSSSKYKRFGIYILYLVRLVKFFSKAMKLSLVGNEIIYSGSDFWPDAFPAWILKMRFRKVKWIASFYLFAPNPFSKKPVYKGKRMLRGLLYYFSQVPVYFLVKKYADMVWVASELDRWRFIDNKRLTPEKVVAIRWGVDTEISSAIPEPREKKFDAVFIGRFHPQKGILELIDIWRYVCKKKPDAKLAIIGTGELERDVRKEISEYGLENNVILFGFKDGVEKLKIFKESKVVIYPAIFDTGAIAPMEAMSCGLPCVMFDLPAFRTYYPKGVIKVPKGNLRLFADSILGLLSDTRMYETFKDEAMQLTRELDWSKKADELSNLIKEVFGIG